MQAPGCLLPYSNGVAVPACYKNPLVADDLEKDELEGWDDLLQSIDSALLIINDQDHSEKADVQGDKEMFDSSGR